MPGRVSSGLFKLLAVAFYIALFFALVRAVAPPDTSVSADFLQYQCGPDYETYALVSVPVADDRPEVFRAKCKYKNLEPGDEVVIRVFGPRDWARTEWKPDAVVERRRSRG